MKRTCHISLFICMVTAIASTTSMAASAGLLNAQSFPKTANDASFIERMQNLADGYDEFDSLYDANGNCVSGCAYKGIKLEDVLSASRRATEAAKAKLLAYQAMHPDPTTPYEQPGPNHWNDNNDVIPPITPHVQPTQPILPIQPPIDTTTPDVPVLPVNPPITSPNPDTADEDSEFKCPTGRYSKYIPRGNALVNYAPIDTDLVITSDMGERSVSGGSSWHQGIDLRATDGTAVYLPANGVVTFVGGGDNSTAGKYIWVYHPAEGIYTRYLHLGDSSLVKKGDKIQGGCLFAKSGHSGRGRNGKPYKAHLHYEIKQSQTNDKPDVIDPFGGDVNRLGRGYKFKSRNTMRPSRNGVPPIGCVGFLS